MGRRVALGLVAVLVAAMSVALGVSPAGATTTCPGSTMTPGQTLKDGTSCTTLNSRGRHFVLDVSAGGLDLQQRVTPTQDPGPLDLTTGPTWTEQSLEGDNYSGLALILRSTGNLVLVTPRGVAVWSTHTARSGAAYLELQDNGRLVLRTRASKVVWASNSGYFALGSGDHVGSGQRLISTTNYYGARTISWTDTTTMQTNGDLVYQCSRAAARVVWHTNTHVPGSYLVFDPNGEEVVRAPSGRALWSSPTRGYRDAFSMMGTNIYGLTSAWTPTSYPRDAGC